MAVAHIGNGDCGIFHAGNVDKAGEIGKQLRLAGRMVVERGVHETECLFPAQRLGGKHVPRAFRDT